MPTPTLPGDEFDPNDIALLPSVIADGMQMLSDEDQARILSMRPCGTYLARLDGGWVRVWVGPVPATGDENDYVLVGDFHISALGNNTSPGSLN